MSFQWIFDKASNLSINKQPTVSQTVTRNNRVSAVVKGGDTYRFTVTMPAGLPYEENRAYIEAYEALGRYTVDPISIPQSYITGYRGVATNTTGWTAYVSAANPAVIHSLTPSVTPVNGDKILAAGDYVQLGAAGNTYNVVSDVTWPNTTATLHRNIHETGAVNLTIGSAVTWDVICTSMPTWNIFDYNLVNWQGEFVFYEVIR
jgi:hypothetical protein